MPRPSSSVWAVLVGGTVPGMRLEVHDLLFAVGETIDDCTPSLRAQWRGEPAGLHRDAWGRLDAADGREVALSDAAPDGPRLWFVHTGGYDTGRFAELHDNHFVVASDRDEAKRRAVARHAAWTLPHKDALLDVDAVVDLTDTVPGRHLVPGRHTGAEFAFVADYVPIG